MHVLFGFLQCDHISRQMDEGVRMVSMRLLCRGQRLMGGKDGNGLLRITSTAHRITRLIWGCVCLLCNKIESRTITIKLFKCHSNACDEPHHGKCITCHQTHLFLEFITNTTIHHYSELCATTHTHTHTNADQFACDTKALRCH